MISSDVLRLHRRGEVRPSGDRTSSGSAALCRQLRGFRKLHSGPPIACQLLHMSIRLLLVLALPAVTACVGNIQRSARVPHPGVPLSSGQPLDTRAEFAAGLSNVTDVMKPRVGDATQAV